MPYYNKYKYVRLNSFSKKVSELYNVPNNNELMSLLHGALYIVSRRVFSPKEIGSFKKGELYNEKFLNIIWNTYGEALRKALAYEWKRRRGLNECRKSITRDKLVTMIKEAIEKEINIVSCAVYIFSNINGVVSILAGRRSTEMSGWQQHNGGLFNVPVGMKENGESDVECAVREVKEETGISLNANSLKDAGIEMWGPGKYGRNFIVKCNGNLNIGDGDGENERFMWIPLDKVDSVRWAFNMGNTVKQMANKI